MYRNRLKTKGTDYSAATVTGVTQTKLTNHKAELKQKISTFLASANQMSSTEQRNFNFFVRHGNRSIQTWLYGGAEFSINFNSIRFALEWL